MGFGENINIYTDSQMAKSTLPSSYGTKMGSEVEFARFVKHDFSYIGSRT